MATVIINLASAIPWLGKDLTEFIWGAYSVSSPTITRFFTLHYTLAFILAAAAAAHMIALHEHGSGNPLGLTSNTDRIPMHPYYTIKDSITVVSLLLATALLIAFIPNVLGQAWPFISYLDILSSWVLLLESIPKKDIMQCAICWNSLTNESTLLVSGSLVFFQ